MPQPSQSPSTGATQQQQRLEQAFRVNLNNLKRLDAQTVDIVDRAVHVVVYRFEDEQLQWVKDNVEGTLFLTKRGQPPFYGLVILNRLGPDNLVVMLDLAQCKLEKQETGFLMLRDTTGTRGLWFHDENDLNRISDCCLKYQQVYPKSATNSTTNISPVLSTQQILSPKTVELQLKEMILPKSSRGSMSNGSATPLSNEPAESTGADHAGQALMKMLKANSSASILQTSKSTTSTGKTLRQQQSMPAVLSSSIVNGSYDGSQSNIPAWMPGPFEDKKDPSPHDLGTASSAPLSPQAQQQKHSHQQQQPTLPVLHEHAPFPPLPPQLYQQMSQMEIQQQPPHQQQLQQHQQQPQQHQQAPVPGHFPPHFQPFPGFPMFPPGMMPPFPMPMHHMPPGMTAPQQMNAPGPLQASPSPTAVSSEQSMQSSSYSASTAVSTPSTTPATPNVSRAATSASSSSATKAKPAFRDIPSQVLRSMSVSSTQSASAMTSPNSSGVRQPSIVSSPPARQTQQQPWTQEQFIDHYMKEVASNPAVQAGLYASYLAKFRGTQ